MARLDDIEDLVAHYSETLLKLYKETDPALGEDGEVAKLELARQAVGMFWYMHGKLLSWAQAHLTGYAILCEHPELVRFLEEKLGHDVTEDSHILEQVGLQYNFNPPDDTDPDYERTYEWLTGFKEGISDDNFKGTTEAGEYVFLNDAAMRRLIDELLMSRSADNSYWRMELQHSLRALNEGEVDALARPRAGKRQGLPYSLARWKLEALRQVRFRVGRGMKKYRALEEIADGIGQSVETLRSWEKELEANPDRWHDLYCSELAGRFRSDLTGRPLVDFSSIPGYEDYGFWRGNHLLELAAHLIPRIESRTLEEIKSKIFEYRQKQPGG